MPKYRVHFANGTTVEKEAASGTDAKIQAKKEQRRELPPNHEESDPAIRVVRVEDLSAV